MVRPRSEDLHHLGEERIHAGAHVERGNGEPQTSTRSPSHSRSQAPQAAAEDAGQHRDHGGAPWRSSTRWVDQRQKAAPGTKPAPVAWPPHVTAETGTIWAASMPCSRIQRRSWLLALILLASVYRRPIRVCAHASIRTALKLPREGAAGLVMSHVRPLLMRNTWRLASMVGEGGSAGAYVDPAGQGGCRPPRRLVIGF